MTDTIGGPAPAWLLRLNSQLDAADQRATVVARGLTPQQLNWSRSPAEWSVGQCLEHLAIANAVYLRAMSRSLEGRRAGLVEEIAPGWFGRLFIRTVIEPSPKMRRRPAPKKIRPGAQVPPTVEARTPAPAAGGADQGRSRCYGQGPMTFSGGAPKPPPPPRVYFE